MSWSIVLLGAAMQLILWAMMDEKLDFNSFDDDDPSRRTELEKAVLVLQLIVATAIMATAAWLFAMYLVSLVA